MPIFQDSQGLAVKFFIQKDLPQQTQAELCETITSLGGRVESKVPRQGYILVLPGTSEEERLRLCWSSPDRPDRHFVPYTYVEACKIAGMILKQIFIHEGQPIKMHIHSSIANVNARHALSQRIQHSGGDPTASAQSARVILADPTTEVFQHLVHVYQGIPDKFIESYLWVRKCVEKEAVVYTPLVYKNPGGRRPGEERTQFTEEDEERLCNWIAGKIPFKETGGRTGNRLYQQLCELSNDPEYAWASRHTWQSWRERYKKNAPRLDVKIGVIVDQKKPVQGEKGQYGYVRMAEEKPKRARKKRAQDSNASINGVGPLVPDPEVLKALEPDKAEGPSSLSYNVEPISMPLHARTYTNEVQHVVSSGGGPVDPIDPIIRNTNVEEMEDAEEDRDWSVRIGNEVPPTWGKRKVSEGAQSESNIPKRQRGETRSTAPVPNIQGDIQQVLDSNIRAIAAQCRFTVDEVQEYYDKVGDMERTSSRFMNMRAELINRFQEDES